MQVPRAWGDRRYLIWTVGAVAVIALIAIAAMHRMPAAPTVTPARDPEMVLAQVASPTPAERADRARAAQGDRASAVRLATHLHQLATEHADPRYDGRAQAVLARWWAQPTPPDDVLYLRAVIRQHIHDFAAARADLDTLIQHDPGDPNARLTRAAVATVMGDLATAAADCNSLASAGDLIVTACAAPLYRAGGDLGAAYARLDTALAGGASPDFEGWARVSLGEIARARGDDTAAEKAFRAALALTPTDTYTLSALADLLLDGKRDAEAADLLRTAGEGADNLLLRLAIAEHRLGDPAAAVHTKVIRGRLEAGMARGDYTHQREYGRYLLELANDPRGALKAALMNWDLQKESTDARLVIDCAAAAHDPGAAKAVLAWNAEHKITDAVIDRAVARLGGAK